MPFGNRRGSARGAFDDDEPDTSGRPKSGGLAKIVRAASFSRRKKNDETSSGSSSTQSSPTADGTPLKGWLSKRHNKEKSVSQQWGRRYFSVDGVRGTLSYAKGEAKTPSAILPLADISSVTPFDGHKHGAHAFVISCPPVHLTVRAEDEQERTMWINGLTAKAAEWKGKSGVRTAVADPYAPPATATTTFTTGGCAGCVTKTLREAKSARAATTGAITAAQATLSSPVAAKSAPPGFHLAWVPNKKATAVVPAAGAAPLAPTTVVGGPPSAWNWRGLARAQLTRVALAARRGGL